VDNRILPLPERARSQTPRGIGQLPEQTLRNTIHIGDDKGADYSRAGPEKFDHATPTFDLISPNPGQPQSRRRWGIGRASAIERSPSDLDHDRTTVGKHSCSGCPWRGKNGGQSMLIRLAQHGWGLHRLESAAFARRTPHSDIGPEHFRMDDRLHRLG
jgi:hypothetical protein